jgi:hypothetical protein
MNESVENTNRSALAELVAKSLGAQELALRQESVLERFGAVVSQPDALNIALALHPFTELRPLRYFSEAAFACALQIFEENPRNTLQALSKFAQEWSHAIQSLFRCGSSWNMEGRLELNEAADLLPFERVWHPEYQRYSEHVFNHLIKVPLELQGNAVGKNFVAQTLAQRAKKLIDLGFPELSAGFSSVVRNSISHGSSFYGDQEIRYRDEYNGRITEEVFIPSDFSQLFDDLVDSCSGIAAAALAFIARHQAEVESSGYQNLPLGIRYAILRGWASHQAFSVDGMIEVQGQSPHLNIYCSSRSMSRSFQRYEALRVAARAVQAGCTNYDRICVSIDCGASVAGLVVFNGPQLMEALRPQATLEALRDVIRADLLWHDESAAATKWSLLKRSFDGAWAKTKRDLISRWKRSGLGVWKHRYTIRNIEPRTAGKTRRLMAEVVLHPDEEVSLRTVRGVIQHAVQVLKRTRLPASSIGKETRWRAKPSYVWLRLHRRDARVRGLQSRQPKSLDLLAEAEWTTFTNRSQPIQVKQPDDGIVRGIRIKYAAFRP